MPISIPVGLGLSPDFHGFMQSVHANARVIRHLGHDCYFPDSAPVYHSPVILQSALNSLTYRRRRKMDHE